MKLKIVRKRVKNDEGFIWKSVKSYIKASTPKELSFDWIIPFLLSLIIFILTFVFVESNLAMLDLIEKINNTAINVIAILAGFNTASLAIITSSNRELLNKISNTISPSEKVEFKKSSFPKRLKNAILNNSKSNTLEITINFFCYAVIIQLITLVFGLLTSITYDFIPNLNDLSILSLNNLLEKSILLIYGIFWLTLVLHSIFISIRNVEVVYHFILYKDKK